MNGFFKKDQEPNNKEIADLAKKINKEHENDSKVEGGDDLVEVEPTVKDKDKNQQKKGTNK